MRWYVTPGMSCVTAADAEGASRNTANKAKTTVRRIRPQFTLAQAAAIVSVVAFLLTTGAHAGAAGHTHDRPVPILMYHLIAEAPAGAAFPELFVSPSDFAAQMNWLAAHGYHAVTLHRVYEYWWRGTPLPVQPVVISFDDGTLGQHIHARPVLAKLHWPDVSSLKANTLKSRYSLPAWRVRAFIAAGWELDAHSITHPDLTQVGDAQLWQDVN